MQPAHTKRWRQRTLCRAAALALAVVVFGLSQAGGQPDAKQTLLKQSYVTPGNSKTIQLYADNVATWVEGGKRAFLLKGRVWIEQGTLSVRMPQGVVWVDEDKKSSTGIYHLGVYGEGDVTVDEGPKHAAAATAALELATRGEVRIKAYASKVVQKEMPDDPLYKRALAGLTATPAADEKIQKAGGPVPDQGPVVPIPTVDPKPQQPPIQKVQDPLPPPPPGPTVTPAPGVPGAPPTTFPPPPPITPGDPNLPAAPDDKTPKQLSIRPRSARELQVRNYALNGETVVIVTTPVILRVTDPATKKVLLDIEADRLAFWTKGNPNEILGNLQSHSGETSKSLEFFLSGNVEIRNQAPKRKDGKEGESEILRADEVYYDVGRGVAIALRADLELRDSKLPNPLHFEADELIQMNPKLYTGKSTRMFSTILPSDPGLTIDIREFELKERDTVKRTIFGLPFRDKEGQPESYQQKIFTGRGNVLRLEGVPLFWAPWIQGDVDDPLGPLDGINLGYNKVFGFQIYTTWNMYDLLGVAPPEGTRWKLYVDGLTERGPALGTQFDFAGRNLFGIPCIYSGIVKAYGIHDVGKDVLGSDRGEVIYLNPVQTLPITHTEWRGRLLYRANVQEMPLGFSVQAQASAFSDRNYFEQFFNQEFNNELNQETFLYVKQQQGIWAWDILAEANIRRWITETEWLPKAEAQVIGFSLFDLLTYNVHGSAGFGRLRPTEMAQFAYFATDQRVDTGRFDLWQDISLPLTLGAFKVVPYLAADLAYYTSDLAGNDRGRLYGGAGVRGSIPFSRLFPDVQSDIFNLNGIFHKITLAGNWYAAHSNVHINELPQLDRLNDDISDQALRDMFLRQITLNPANAAFLTTSPVVDPQIFALRRLVFNRADTLDSIDVVQFGLNQRWQTKRGFPGQEHIIDWMTFNIGASIFPHSNRDNFGQPVGIIEYDWFWNIGDRTALSSTGWFETLDGGPRVWNFGAFLGRPDMTNFYLGYRQIDPLESKAVIASIVFPFSAKYAVTASTSYDFGTEVQFNSLNITRIGTDLQVTLGISYSSTLNTVGFQFEILPNLLPANRRGAGAFNPAMMAQGQR